MKKISASARLGVGVLVGNNVILEDDVVIGDYTIIRDNVHIGRGTHIGPFSLLGEHTSPYYSEPADYVNPPTRVGAMSVIRSHSVIYADVVIGSNFQSGHRVTIREKAFIGNNSRIGTLSDIQGHCEIGNYVSIHSNVHIGQGSKVKDFVWIFPYVVLTNDPTPPSETIEGCTLERFCIIATGSILLPGVTVGMDALVGAMTCVKKNVPPETVVIGNPGKEVCSVRRIKNKTTRESVYPWRNTFKRGMPWESSTYEQWYSSLDIPQE